MPWLVRPDAGGSDPSQFLCDLIGVLRTAGPTDGATARDTTAAPDVLPGQVPEQSIRVCNACCAIDVQPSSGADLPAHAAAPPLHRINASQEDASRPDKP
jgi:hypothetical protein